jgi:hypothetical protein
VKPGKPVDRKAIIKLKQSHAAHACFFSWNQAKQTAAVLLKVLNKPLVCLDQARLRDFCDWTLKDEMAVEELCVFLTYPDYDDRIKEVIKLRAEYRYEQGYGPNADRPRLDTLKRQLNGLWPRSPKDNATDGRWDLDGLWAAHVVAAAITVALRKDKGLSVPVAFERMKKLLALMHNYNRRWGLAQELSLSEYEET